MYREAYSPLVRIGPNSFVPNSEIVNLAQSHVQPAIEEVENQARQDRELKQWKQNHKEELKRRKKQDKMLAKERKKLNKQEKKRNAKQQQPSQSDGVAVAEGSGPSQNQQKLSMTQRIKRMFSGKKKNKRNKATNEGENARPSTAHSNLNTTDRAQTAPEVEVEVREVEVVHETGVPPEPTPPLQDSMETLNERPRVVSRPSSMSNQPLPAERPTLAPSSAPTPEYEHDNEFENAPEIPEYISTSMSKRTILLGDQPNQIKKQEVHVEKQTRLDKPSEKPQQQKFYENL